jgi:DNA-binding PadR family transcriptional regulator
MAADASTPSNLGFAVLGLLVRQDATGYELARSLERPVGYFWTARHSQIYPELARLAEAGLVDYDERPGRGPRATKHYRITGKGRTALARWVASEFEPQPVRDLEVLRLWSVWIVTPDVAREVVHQARERHADVLARYQEELTDVNADPHALDPGHPRFASRLTLEGGVRTRRAAVEWCDWMLTQWE